MPAKNEERRKTSCLQGVSAGESSDWIIHSLSDRGAPHVQTSEATWAGPWPVAYCGCQEQQRLLGQSDHGMNEERTVLAGTLPQESRLPQDHARACGATCGTAAVLCAKPQ